MGKEGEPLARCLSHPAATALSGLTGYKGVGVGQTEFRPPQHYRFLVSLEREALKNYKWCLTCDGENDHILPVSGGFIVSL